MDNQPTIQVLDDAELDDAELDAVSGGKHGGGSAGGGGTVIEIVEISIGEIVAVGHPTVSFVVEGIGNQTSATTSSKGHKHH